VTAAWIALCAVLGGLIGSFANVVVYRWPRGESVVAPRSRCPACARTLGPLDLVPVGSWLALRGRCRTCAAPISSRYPLVEAAFALGFGGLAWAFPITTAGATVVPLLVLFAMLTTAALIDLDTFLLPDALTLPAVVVAVVGAFWYEPGTGLPTPTEALVGAAVGAGVLVLINRIGSLVLRRFADTEERLWPFSLDAVNIAALAGVVGGWRWALAAGAMQVVVSALARRAVRLPEPVVYALWLVALVLVGSGWALGWGVGIVEGVAGSTIGAGVFALAGAVWWWVVEALQGERKPPLAEAGPPEDDEGEPVAMGFGDVKLAAPLGALLGWEGFLVGLLFAVVLGAVLGVTQRALGGSRFVPFGPYLVVGAFAAFFFGDALIGWYLGLLGV
jgi:leader peptidase (prepilin peptidase) / N-methyltransferase